MSEIRFEDIKFEEKGDEIIVHLLKIFSTKLLKSDLERIGSFSAKDGSLFFDNVSEKSALNKLLILLQKAFGNLKNDVTGHSAVYIHRNSGIPLLGSAAFGLVDRNSSMIEVKPITGCNMNCVFCSVDEGLSSKKTNDFVVEEAYLVEECEKIVALKKIPCQVVINTHGECLLYSPIVELVRDLKQIPNVEEVSLITNGTLLTNELIDQLAEAGLDSLNMSVNAIAPEKARILQGTALYDAKKVQEMATYAAKKFRVILAPVLVQGKNEDELKKIVLFAKKIGAKTGIQNFLHYSGGRNPAGQVPMADFYKLLKSLEAETGEKLIVAKEDFRIKATKPLPKPFLKNQVVKARIVANGRCPGEKLAVANERVITLPGTPSSGMVKVQLTRDKHNIFFGKVL
jgi:uncharacterized protein